MKNNVFLIQFRESKLVARHEKKCISRYLGRRANLISKNVFLENFNFSDRFFSRTSAVILGGSDFSFSEKEKHLFLWNKIKKNTPFLKKIIKKDIPSLGICFGHQYLAYILDAEIVRNKFQEEVGTFKLFLTKEGRIDPLFCGIPSKFLVQEAHKDCVKKLPAKTIYLARGGKCKIQAFRYKNIYGVQFHPELNIKDMKYRASFYPNYMVGKRINFRLSLFGKKVLNNFFDIYVKKQK